MVKYLKYGLKDVHVDVETCFYKDILRGKTEKVKLQGQR